MSQNMLLKRNNLPLYSFFVLLLMSSSATAQSYVPLGDTNPPTEGQSSTLKKEDLISRLGFNNVLTVGSATRADTNPVPAPAVLPTCNPVPTVDQIKGSLEYHQAFMSTSAAAKLGIPIAGFGGSGTGSQSILVRDFSRGTQCLSTDGTTALFYGQAIRMLIAMSSIEGKADVTLPFIAANASLNNKSNQVSIVVYGFSNPAIDAVVANIAGKELNVETYADFVKVEKDLITLIANPATEKSVVRLGAISNAPPPNLKENVIAAYALQQISDGRSCMDAKSRFRSRDDSAARVLDETYMQVTGACSATAPEATKRIQAGDLLLGLKVKY